MKELVSVFGRLGLLGFGGPIATMAMMEEEAVRNRKWLSIAQFSEIYALTKILPGPVATQMAVYLGWLRHGTLGGLLAGSLFILPCFLLVLVFSYFYMRSGLVSRADALFGGMQAGAIAIIALSTYQLAKPYRAKVDAWVIIAISAVLILVAPRWEPLVILVFGFLGAIRVKRSVPAFFLLGSIQGGIPILAESKLAQLFWVCFKSGAFVFGSGLAIVPLLEADVVGHYQWLTHSEFMDGLAIGQVTPGPVVITATFIGYHVAGFTGACVATIGMFLPAFFNILVILPRVLKRVEGRAWMTGFASRAIPAVIGGILGAMLRLGWLTFIESPMLIGVFILALLLAFKLKLPAWGVIPLAGAFSWMISRIPYP